MDKQLQDNNLGTIVNLDEAVIPLRLTHELVDRLQRKAQFGGYPSVEAYCESIVVNSLSTKVSAPTIDSPGYMSGNEAKKITGPSHSGMVKRA